MTTKPAADAAPVHEISTDLFRHEVSRVSRTIGRAHDIEVVFAGDEAKTNGSKIVMPSLPADRGLTNVQARAMRGYADHESLHVRKTDMDAWKRYAGAGKKLPEVWEAYSNAVEDVRIERYGIEEYPGMQKNIAGIIELQEKRVAEAIAADPALASDPAKAGAMALTLEARKRMGTAVSECERMLAMFSPEVQDLAKKWADLATYLPDGKEGTMESIRLARTILGDLKLIDEEEQPERSGRGPGGGRGDSEEGGGTGGEGGADGDTDSDSEGGELPSGRTPDTDKPVPPVKNVKIGLDPELARTIENTAREITEVAKGEDGFAYRVMNPENDAWHTKTSGTYYSARLADEDGISYYESDLVKTGGNLGVMRRKLERMVLAKQRRDWDVAREHGAIDPKRLTQAAMGNRFVHRVRIDRPEMETAVLILIDLSGSMSGHKAILAQQVGIALAQCLNTIGADYAVVGFSNTHGAGKRSRMASRREGEAHGEWGRTEPLDMVEFKGFDETLREARSSLGQISRCIGGNNSDNDALIEAWNHLRARHARRHVMITLSDGAPAWHSPLAGTLKGNWLNEWTKRAVQRIIREGGEVAGVGILDESVKRFYPTWAVARDMDEFAGKTMDTLAAMLLGQRARVRAAA